MSQDLVRPVKSTSSNSSVDCFSIFQAEKLAALPAASSLASASLAGLEARYFRIVLSILNKGDV